MHTSSIFIGDTKNELVQCKEVWFLFSQLLTETGKLLHVLIVKLMVNINVIQNTPHT